ncbi:hypothetical protein [Sphingomonas profundi]|uniref:hypothetical protein n=1 Tax=Alterirhizorhabdus profundi TaxID=2681549 RepID=UPI0012E74BAE|nr:hypothetical protein [Sphingomonas profundi]
MNFSDGRNRMSKERLLSSLLLFSFGLGVLFFLIALERVNWFHIRPASGVAAAMSYAGGNAPTPSPTGAAPTQPAGVPQPGR